MRRERHGYARQMGQPTQRATKYTARSNIEPAQIFLHANGQSAPRSGSARDVGRGAGSHIPSTASESYRVNPAADAERAVRIQDGIDSHHTNSEAAFTWLTSG